MTTTKPMPDDIKTAIDMAEFISGLYDAEPSVSHVELLGKKLWKLIDPYQAHIAAQAEEIESTKQTAAGHYLTWQCTEAGLREKISALEADNQRLSDDLMTHLTAESRFLLSDADKAKCFDAYERAERLRASLVAENKRLREALENIRLQGLVKGGSDLDGLIRCHEIAEAALANTVAAQDMKEQTP